MENQYYPFVNLPLPYAYDAMEPYIDAETMYLHHDRHLQTYINNLNAVLRDNPRLQKLSLEALIRSAGRLPGSVQTSVRNNAGGVYNHRLFFEGLVNPSPDEPTGRPAELIRRQYGSVDGFLGALREAALSVFGSGYAWLVYNGRGLKIVTTPNQNTPLEEGLCPVLNLDVWEHAYYLKHYNLRADYITDWTNVINWDAAERNLERCVAGNPRPDGRRGTRE